MSLFKNQTLDLPRLTIIHKTLKAAGRAIANKIILNYTNMELLTANTPKNDQFSILIFNIIVKVLEF